MNGEHELPLKRVTQDALIKIMLKDPEGWEVIARETFEVATERAMAEHPGWPNVEELRQLLRKHKKTEEEEGRLESLLHELGLSFETLRALIQVAYANKYGYQIVEEEEINGQS